MSLFPGDIEQQAEKLLELCRSKKLKIATAESCTGGLIAGILTEIAGSSDVVDRGFVTYSNSAKEDMLGVNKVLLEKQGAVSAEVALAMAKGALARSNANIAVSVTGIAGPGGGTETKPVGLVHMAVATENGLNQQAHHFGNIGRSAIRLETVRAALLMLTEAAHQPGK